MTGTAPRIVDGVVRAVLALTGLNVGAFWLGLGLLPAVDIWGASLIDVGDIDWLPTLGGFVLIVWTSLGVAKPTPLRFLPPALVSVPLAAIGLWQMSQF